MAATTTERTLATGMRAALLISRKDLRQRLRNRTVWVVGVLAPLLLAAILGQIIGGFTDRAIEPPRWALVGTASGPASATLVDDVLPTVAADLGAELTVLADRSAAVAGLDEATLDAVFVLPDDLDASLAGPAPRGLEVLGRPGAPIAHLVATSVAQSWVDEVEARRIGATAAVLAGRDPAAVGALAATVTAPDVLRAVELPAEDRTLDGASYVSAGLAVFFLFFTVPLGVIGLLEERQGGTLARLQAAPTPGWSILLGKVLTSVAIGMLATLVLVAATTWLLGASWGASGAVVVLVLLAVLAAVSLVTVVAAFADSADAAYNLQGVIGIVLGMLGGAFFPVATKPGVLATLSDLTPHGMFITAVADLQAPGAGVADIVPQLAGLFAFAAAVSVGASGLVNLRGGR